MTSTRRELIIIGGGIVGALEAYFAYKEALSQGIKLAITIYEKSRSFDAPQEERASTNTSYNIFPSLTVDDILSIVPRGSELVEKLSRLFNQPDGIRVDDVESVNDSLSALQFKKAVSLSGEDPDHHDRTLSLLALGKISMDLWQQFYDEGDAELQYIFINSNFNPCHEPKIDGPKMLRDGYRIDLMYGIKNVEEHALKMQANYERLGYKHCALLSPDEVLRIDPSLIAFCTAHSDVDQSGDRVWKQDCVAFWRPGGCIDTHCFLPKLYDYLKRKMGQNFQLHFDSEVSSVEFTSNSIAGLKLGDGKKVGGIDSQYVLCPGEAMGTLQKWGFDEPAYAAFAGPSLRLTIPLTPSETEQYSRFFHCMEVHSEGIVLAWQARLKENAILIGVAGTKAFYGNKQPHISEAFARDRFLVLLNMINHVLPQFVSLACGHDTTGRTLGVEVLKELEARGIAKLWVGRRAVAYDGFPTLGALYVNNQKIQNARVTTHLASGGVSCGPAAVMMSRSSLQRETDPFVQKILRYSDSRRKANKLKKGPTYSHPSWIEVDLAQFKRNIAIVRDHIGNTLFCLPVKANAYGHGLVAIGKAAEEAGVDYLGVAHLQEGIALRNANIRLPIIVLGAIHEDQIGDLIQFNLEFSVSSLFKAKLVAEKCKMTGQKCRVHLEVDTGMHRTGVRPSTAVELMHYLKSAHCFEIVGVYSHLATAGGKDDPFALQQISHFQTLMQHPLFQDIPLVRHMANSAGTLYFPESHFDMVRPSLLSFGYLPETYPDTLSKIAPCFSVKTKVSYFKVVEQGAGISYGRSHITQKKTRIVTLPIGYGDGYKRCLSNRGSVLIRGQRFPIVGAICMDQLMVDIGESEVYVGEEAVLIGRQGNAEISVQEIASLCDTIPYEVLCFFNDRLPRVYL
jgi:alanine racemase